LWLTPVQLVELAPALAPYLPAPLANQTWPAIVEAAHWLSGELGINHTLWARACHVMGREYAAVALALVTTRPAAHFTSGPGGYFAGMLRKFEKGELHLDRTLWKLRTRLWGNDRRRGTTRH
jgi:replication initiation protein RepC